MVMMFALASAMAIVISVEAGAVPGDQVGQTLMRSKAPISVSVDQSGQTLMRSKTPRKHQSHHAGQTLMRNKALTGSGQKRFAADVDAQASASSIEEESRINKGSVIADSRRVCSDTADFSDGQAFACEAWSGYDCFKAVEDSADSGYSYSQQEEDEILANCRASCGLCPRGGSQQQANCVQVAAGEVAPESGIFTSADGTQSNVAVTAGTAAPAAGLFCPMAKRCLTHEVCFVDGKDASSTYCNIDNGCAIGGCSDTNDAIDGTCPGVSNNEEPVMFSLRKHETALVSTLGIVVVLCCSITCLDCYFRRGATGASNAETMRVREDMGADGLSRSLLAKDSTPNVSGANPYAFVNTWGPEKCVELGPKGCEHQFKNKMTLLNPEVYKSVKAACEAINAGKLEMPKEGYCVIFSERHQKYFLMFRADKEQEARAVVGLK
jgi:hypothetical protein